MIKLFTNYTLEYYKNSNKNNDWLSLYDKLTNEKHFYNFKNIVEQFIIDNGCIVYGSKAVELAIKSKIYNFKMKINDFDVYTPYPKSLAIKLFNDLKNNINIYSLKCLKSRTPGTFTVFINEIKIIDFTFINKDNFYQLHFNKTDKDLKYISLPLSIANYTSILSNTQTYFQYSKALDNLSILTENHLLKLVSSDKILFNKSSIPKIIETLTTHFNKYTSKPIYSNIKIDYLKYLSQTSVIDNILDLKPNIYHEHESLFETTNNDLPILYKYTTPVNDYFFTGIHAINLFLNNFSTSIEIKNYENIFELYTSSNNSYIQQFVDFFKSSKIKATLTNFNYPFIFKNCVILEIDNYKFILYELESEFMYNIVKSKYHCSTYTFLISHLLICSNYLYKNDYKIYNDALYHFVTIANNNHLDNIFHPLGNYNDTYKLAGLKYDIIRINNVLDKHEQEYENSNNEQIKININYDSTNPNSCT